MFITCTCAHSLEFLHLVSVRPSKTNGFYGYLSSLTIRYNFRLCNCPIVVSFAIGIPRKTWNKRSISIFSQNYKTSCSKLFFSMVTSIYCSDFKIYHSLFSILSCCLSIASMYVLIIVLSLYYSNRMSIGQSICV